MTRRLASRRTFAATFASVVLAGCSSVPVLGGGDSDSTATATPASTATPTPDPTATPTATPTPAPEADVTIEVGPDGSYAEFVPPDVRISTGETVEWLFESTGHNVCGHPDHDPRVELPADAEPFGSDPADNREAIDAAESRYTHTFETAGDYAYVCVLHAHDDMVGRVTVR
ncbi:plastocyanin/azurin family copper-binding protein [Haloplanus sp. C73]|uniref:plastocyanin/azurin family copper-binding protein n=1 Tax=Haloplanus sp. C73 TaxID=3421641 RepID=UPI003EB97176